MMKSASMLAIIIVMVMVVVAMVHGALDGTLGAIAQHMSQDEMNHVPTVECTINGCEYCNQ